MHIRIFLSSLFAMGVMASSNLQAQATIVDAPDTIFVALDTLAEGGAVEAHWDIANDSEVALELMVTRTFLDTVSPFNYPYSSDEPGAFERFCWGPTCFNYGTDSSPSNAAFLVTLQPGQSTNSFRSDYYPNSVVGSSTLQYCFHPVGEPLGGVCHAVTFTAVATASVEQVVSQVAPSLTLFPNPTLGSITVQTEGSASGVIEIRNLLGQRERVEMVPGGSSSVTLDVSDLEPGMWFVTYQLEGRSQITRRLVIR